MQNQTVSFNFRSIDAKKASAEIIAKEAWAITETKKNAETGEEIQVITGYKRPALTLEIPFLQFDDLANIVMLAAEAIEKGEPATKESSLVLELMNAAITEQAREQVDSDLDFSQDKLDTGKLTWSYIANIPKSDRRGSGISKELWELFGANYISVLSAATTIAPEKIEKQAEILLGKYNKVKTNKKIVSQLAELVDTWFAQTELKEQFAPVYEFLTEKANLLVNASEEQLEAALF